MITTTRMKGKKASDMIDYDWFDKKAYSNACADSVEVPIKNASDMEKGQISDEKVIEEIKNTAEKDQPAIKMAVEMAGDKLTDVRPASRVSESSLVASRTRGTLLTGNVYSTDMKRQAKIIGINGRLCMLLFGLMYALCKHVMSLYVFSCTIIVYQTTKPYSIL